MLHVQADRFNRGVLNLVSDCFKAHRLASSLLKSVDSFRLSLATVEKLSDATSSREKLSSKRESADRAEGYRVWLQPMYCRLVEAQQSGLERLDCLVVQNVKIIDQLARLKADLGEESKWGTVDADSSTEASASNARHEATPQAERIFRQKRMRRDRRSDDQSVSTKSTLSSMRAFAREAKRIRQHRENEDNDRVSVMFSLNMSPSHHSDSFGYVTGFGAHLESLEEMDDAVDDASAASETSPEDVDQDDGGKDNMPRHDGIITIAEYHQLLRGMGWE